MFPRHLVVGMLLNGYQKVCLNYSAEICSKHNRKCNGNYDGCYCIVHYNGVYILVFDVFYWWDVGVMPKAHYREEFSKGFNGIS